MISKTFHPSGHYRVNDTIYTNKIDAIKACGSGQYPHWDFQQSKFEKYDWTIEPSQDLYDLYRDRALDLRSRYDQVILYFSGGIDSTNMLFSFLDNNIPIDLIVSYGCFSLPGHEQMTRNAEIYKVALPLIRKIESERGIKLPYYLMDDFGLLTHYQDESWIKSSGPGSWSPEIFTFNWHGKDAVIAKHLDRGRSVLVRGIDKPRVIYENGHWYASFLDFNTTGLLSSSNEGDINKWHQVEYFYWHGDFALPLIKQCHMVKNWFKKLLAQGDLSVLDLLSRSGSRFNRSLYTDFVDPIVYGRYLRQRPGQARDYFSVGKPKIINQFTKDHIWFQAGESRHLEIWQQGLRQICNGLDPRWLNNKDTNDILSAFTNYGLLGLWSKSYLLE